MSCWQNELPKALFMVLMLIMPAIPQDDDYHDFADLRSLLLGNQPTPTPPPLPVQQSPPMNLFSRAMLCLCLYPGREDLGVLLQILLFLVSYYIRDLASRADAIRA